MEHSIDRVIYVSSVHAIPERPIPEVITETDRFSPDAVEGQYAKSKAAAAQIAMEAVRRGLNLSIVHPSGIIGPGDVGGRNHLMRTIDVAAHGKLPAGTKGGYDLVDVRDVAEEILDCVEKGEASETDSEYFALGEQMYEKMLSDLEHAKDFIFLEYFIVEEGVMWNQILEILKEKAAAGVEVRMLYDDIGCMATLDGKYDRKLREVGIQCYKFNPFRPDASGIHNRGVDIRIITPHIPDKKVIQLMTRSSYPPLLESG